MLRTLANVTFTSRLSSVNYALQLMPTMMYRQSRVNVTFCILQLHKI